jgi:hypothetical protein
MASRASFSATVRISCLTSEAYDHDTWTVFFCEDCPSRQAVEAAMTAIANDPDVIALALSHAVNSAARAGRGVRPRACPGFRGVTGRSQVGPDGSI